MGDWKIENDSQRSTVQIKLQISHEISHRKNNFIENLSGEPDVINIK